MKLVPQIHSLDLLSEEYQFSGKIEIFPQLGGWHFVRVPTKITKELSPLFPSQRGLIPATVTVGSSTWNTSLLPYGDGTHFVALKASVRKTEGVQLGDTVTITFKLRER